MTRQKTILAIDDSRTMRDMLYAALSEAGFRVVQGGDGEEGLELLKTEAVVDVIITDINMPRLDGYGFIERVRGQPEHRATPILVLTTECEPDKRDRARRAGATGWIVKPFNTAKLVEAIRRVAA